MWLSIKVLSIFFLSKFRCKHTHISFIVFLTENKNINKITTSVHPTEMMVDVIASFWKLSKLESIVWCPENGLQGTVLTFSSIKAILYLSTLSTWPHRQAVLLLCHCATTEQGYLLRLGDWILRTHLSVSTTPCWGSALCLAELLVLGNTSTHSSCFPRLLFSSV